MYLVNNTAVATMVELAIGHTDLERVASGHGRR